MKHWLRRLLRLLRSSRPGRSRFGFAERRQRRQFPCERWTFGFLDDGRFRTGGPGFGFPEFRIDGHKLAVRTLLGDVPETVFGLIDQEATGADHARQNHGFQDQVLHFGSPFPIATTTIASCGSRRTSAPEMTESAVVHRAQTNAAIPLFGLHQPKRKGVIAKTTKRGKGESPHSRRRPVCHWKVGGPCAAARVGSGIELFHFGESPSQTGSREAIGHLRKRLKIPVRTAVARPVPLLHTWDWRSRRLWGLTTPTVKVPVLRTWTLGVDRRKSTFATGPAGPKHDLPMVSSAGIKPTSGQARPESPTPYAGPVTPNRFNSSRQLFFSCPKGS